MFKKIILTLAAASLLAGSALAFQYDDFAWGLSREKAIGIIRDKHKKPVETKDCVYYADTIFEGHCRVSLYFTENNGLLHTVQISCPTPGIGYLFVKRLNELHGLGIQEDKSIDRYIWAGETENDTLALDFSHGSTELFYSAGEMSEDEQLQAQNAPGDTF